MVDSTSPAKFRWASFWKWAAAGLAAVLAIAFGIAAEYFKGQPAQAIPFSLPAEPPPFPIQLLLAIYALLQTIALPLALREARKLAKGFQSAELKKASREILKHYRKA